MHKENEEINPNNEHPLLVRRSVGLQPFMHARQTLADQEHQRAVYQRQLETKASWDDEQDVSVRRATVSQERRRALLLKIVPTLHCPLCQRFFGQTNSWVFVRSLKEAVVQEGIIKPDNPASRRGGMRPMDRNRGNASYAVCASCWQRRGRGIPSRAGKIRHVMKLIQIATKGGNIFMFDSKGKTRDPMSVKKSELLTPEPLRYKINTHLLVGLRERLDIPAKEFANHMGWSQAYQSQLEHGKSTQNTFSEETWLKMKALFHKHGLDITED